MTLCEDPGCYDPGTGDYDVVVPADQPLGEYKLRVKCSDDETTHCSYLTFYVIEAGGDMPTLSPSLTPLETPSPVEPRTASPNTPTDAPVAPTASPNAPSPLGEPGSPGTPPTPVPAKVECDATAKLKFVYTKEDTKLPLITVAHASGDREEVGCLTLTKLYDWLATAPDGVPEVYI